LTASPVVSPPLAAPPPAPPPIADLPLFGAKPSVQTLDVTGDVVRADMWFESSRMVDKVDDELWLGTSPGPRRQSTGSLVKKLIAPSVILIVVAIFVAGYFAFDGETQAHQAKAPPPAVKTTGGGGSRAELATASPPSAEASNAGTATAGAEQPQPPQPGSEPVAAHAPAKAKTEPATQPAAAAAPAVAAPPEPAPAPEPASVATAQPTAAVHEVKTTQGVVKLVDVRIDSKPSGATVMLVDNGKTSFLGTTPVSASVDPARSYDVILTLEGRPTQMSHIDPARTHHVEVALAKAAGSAKTIQAAASAPAPAAHHSSTHHSVAPTTTSFADPGFDKASPKADASGNGTLMVSSKPPCEIFVDGQPTGLMTPQRSIPLPAGAHKITFVNANQNVKKTVAVAIKVDQTTKLIQNFMGE
jgi:hypothetical protein